MIFGGLRLHFKVFVGPKCIYLFFYYAAHFSYKVIERHTSVGQNNSFLILATLRCVDWGIWELKSIHLKIAKAEKHQTTSYNLDVFFFSQFECAGHSLCYFRHTLWISCVFQPPYKTIVTEENSNVSEESAFRQCTVQPSFVTPSRSPKFAVAYLEFPNLLLLALDFIAPNLRQHG